MRNRERHIKEERLIFVRLDEIESFRFHQVVRVRLAGVAVIVAFERNLLVVLPQPSGIMVVGMPLTIVTEEHVEALLEWTACRFHIPQAPLPGGAGGVTFRL